MEALPPTVFPRRVKRFQSLSMTPLDCHVDFQNDAQNDPIPSSNKNILSNNSSIIMSHPPQQESNPITNQFSFKNRKKLFPNDNSHLKNTLNAQNTSIKMQNLNFTKTSTFINKYKHRKMNSSQILDTCSINGKMGTDRKSNQNSGFIIKNQEKSSGSQSIQDVQFQERKKPHIPNFLLNKKRTPRQSQSPELNQVIQREMYDSMPLNYFQERRNERWKSFKDQIIITSAKSIQSDSNEEFDPPIQKIAYSKATASTLCTILPRQESRQTFRDFQEIQQLKEMSILMQQSDQLHKFQREFETKFRKESNADVNEIEDEIAELFSDQEAQSQEFNQDLLNQLQQLF